MQYSLVNITIYGNPCIYYFTAEENFSAAELQKFSKRYENGYDLLIDTRYNLWLELHHPAEYQKLISSNGNNIA